MAYDRLPLEILRKIFLYLNVPDRLAAGTACWQWYRAVLDGLPYDDMHVILQGDISAGIRILAKSSRTYHTLIIKGGDKQLENSEFWENVGPHLKRLELRECDISDRVFTMALGHCSNLESLCIARCNGLLIPGKLLEGLEDAPFLCSALKNIKELDLSDNSYLCDADFNRIVGAAGKLEKLSLAGCPVAFHPGIFRRFYPDGQAYSTSILTFQTVVGYLERAGTKLKTADFSRTLLDSNAMQRLTATCAESLMELNLVSCRQLGHSGMLTLCQTVPRLQVLNLADNYHMTDRILTCVCDHLTQLRELDLTRCNLLTSNGVAEICRLQQLRVLSLSSCCKVSSAGFVEALCVNLRLRMRLLDVSYCNIDTRTVIALAESMPNLTHLDLTSCSLLTDDAVHVISENLQSLTCLRIAGCDKITDDGLCGDKIVENVGNCRKSLTSLKNLEELNLCGCKEISDDGISSCIRFVGLRRLDLSLCQKLTDAGLVSIANHNPSLDHLTLSKCVSVTDFGVTAALGSLPRLSHLDVQGCPKVTDATLDHVPRCRTLRRLNVSLCGVTEAGIDLLEDSTTRLTLVHRT